MLRFLALLFPLFQTAPVATGDLHVIVKNIEGKGNVIVYLYDVSRADTFPEKPLRTRVVPVSAADVEVIFKDLPYGRYAVTVADDANGNGKLDFYFFGPPKERVLASRYAKGHFGPPKFDDAAFKLETKKFLLIMDFRLK